MKRFCFALILPVLIVAIMQSLAFAQTSKPKATTKPAPQPPISDLFVDVKSIALSNISPMEGDSITISATVINKGTADIKEDIEIRFVEGDPKEQGLKIGSEALILGLKAGASGKVETKWRAAPGDVKIFIIADPDNLIKEGNENNNMVTRTVKVVPGKSKM